ncbi:uncharacterized protein LOC127871673 [Dreissena polymorpha]|uniref:IRS-type PTB domain-containing protein n=1 Tax=Dreissena polymorpha TaxID=45954 RepID=A0A9D4LJB4_DREPO|nr:uncharacterized protein LOC127871673 [Dreissena polymorpha]KAH3858738.1 hypothetical protein DPMN_101366 [Dreissena polymorpha]
MDGYNTVYNDPIEYEELQLKRESENENVYMQLAENATSLLNTQQDGNNSVYNDPIEYEELQLKRESKNETVYMQLAENAQSVLKTRLASCALSNESGSNVQRRLDGLATSDGPFQTVAECSDKNNPVYNGPEEYEELKEDLFKSIPDHRFDVLVKKTALAKKSKIVGNRILVIGSGKISFIEQERVVSFPLACVRRFRHNGFALNIELGRKCVFGEGTIEILSGTKTEYIDNSLRAHCKH